MSKHNYSQYSNKKNKEAREVFETVEIPAGDVQTVIPEVTPEVAPNPVINPVVETVETVELPKTVTGVVANCTKLNVRSEPSITADVVCVLSSGSKVEIDATKSCADWLYVSVDNGTYGYNGYCMKKFVDVRL